jgi:NAD(P)-dependent dehydrogenase (short-subunit alcohol dehydrogenase family)
MRLDGAVALVTGGSSGIGAAAARALAAAGARPLIAGRDPARLQDVAEETGGVALTADLAAAGGPARLAEAAAEAAGPGGVDLLVNNAGVGWAGPLGQMTAQQVADLIAVDLTAPIQLTRLLVPGMIARGHGHVVFVSSIAGATGVRGEAAYSAAKAGLGCFAESLADELTGRGVGVSVIVPGVIDTPFFERRGRPYDRRRPAPLPPQRVASALIGAVEQDRGVVFVPRWLRFPAWLHGAFPGTFRRLARRFG